MTNRTSNRHKDVVGDIAEHMGKDKEMVVQDHGTEDEQFAPLLMTDPGGSASANERTLVVRQEARAFAYEMASAYKSMMAFYQQYEKLSAADAEARLQSYSKPDSLNLREALNCPPEQLSW